MSSGVGTMMQLPPIRVAQRRQLGSVPVHVPVEANLATDYDA
eukprot:CAMPEP_0183372684 /NCGR_PEP_ID=MMETSP0164_2-20130417/109167_1 /TAXON_ID=221442 /ORGANISM="Coccolithus pelagicus ssp braarudi, Strain PLY182g" /LENGTH=41 /DNA_ID= /DNA_START= /DNA_END= /DNA_ORIENTATION=